MTLLLLLQFLPKEKSNPSFDFSSSPASNARRFSPTYWISCCNATHTPPPSDNYNNVVVVSGYSRKLKTGKLDTHEVGIIFYFYFGRRRRRLGGAFVLFLKARRKTIGKRLEQRDGDNGRGLNLTVVVSLAHDLAAGAGGGGQFNKLAIIVF